MQSVEKRGLAPRNSRNIPEQPAREGACPLFSADRTQQGCRWTWPAAGAVLWGAAVLIQTAAADERPAVRFVDQAQQAGIDFAYVNGKKADAEAIRIFETTGGGVAVIDFDGDGWPDLVFTQACPWPPEESRQRGQAPDADGAQDESSPVGPRRSQSPLPGVSPHADRLFRNLGNGRFDDVTALAGLGQAVGYGQGIAVGDFDNDGFPDLYVANIGGNRLYRNNGDGTFTDVTEAAGLNDAAWTTSCLVADLNGDGLPDLYDVNYLTGDEVFTKVCREGGVTRACSPKLFEPAADRMFLNLGDGRFQDATELGELDLPKGSGLGIVAADFDDSGRLSLFVANDAMRNFFFANRTYIDKGPGRAAPSAARSSRRNRLWFVERGLVSGLAFDADGAAQGCMGIAVADADGDGRLDLFVTNFYREPNTLYLQQPGNYFTDAAREAGLREPSLSLLGFGTQFLDADLDGRPDLVIANGHIDDRSDLGEAYRMPPQFFHNAGKGRFVELPAKGLGPYFEGKYLGRGLARLDWNRDGREDFAVSHIGAPAGLLTNDTEPAGRFLAVRLRGTICSRDAIGTTVRLTAGGQTWTSQLTAGDGYQAGNQRQLVFGLGPQQRVDELHVRWPSGTEQTFHDLPADTEVLLIEGGSRPFPLPRSERGGEK